MRSGLKAVAALAATAAAGLAYARWEAQSYRLRRATAPVLPAGQQPIRLLHLSDLHLVPGQTSKQMWVRNLAALRPDAVVVTGDFMSDEDAVPHVLDTLEPLLDVPGMFVLGSNDYYAPKPINPAKYFTGPSALEPDRAMLPWPDLIAGLTDAGWHDLSNTKARIDVAGRTWAVRGVDDPHIERDDYSVVAGKWEDGDLHVGVMHAPYLRVLDAMTNDGADLLVAGHTHGGQLRVPGFGALVTNCDIDRARARGLSSHTAVDPAFGTGRQAALHVSAGLGTSPYAPFRFACPPEATLLTLTARD